MKKLGVREICDVVLKAKTSQKIGNKIFYANEPVIYFDTLKTSTLEGAATTVYSTGARGNSRLIAWEGERTVTFTMEDALISPEGFMILSGAGLLDATESKPVYQHMTETVDVTANGFMTSEEGQDLFVSIPLSEKPYLPSNTAGREGNFAYVMFMKDGEIISEPYIPVHGEGAVVESVDPETQKPVYTIRLAAHDMYDAQTENEATHAEEYTISAIPANYDAVMVDFYVARTSSAKQIEISADKFGGNYYLEASTLFRDTNGVDLPAEFIIPNCKIQSNFTFTMASSGDPSTFTFTLDAFPDYTRFDHTKKVLSVLQIIDSSSALELHRHQTVHETAHNRYFD